MNLNNDAVKIMTKIPAPQKCIAGEDLKEGQVYECVKGNDVGNLKTIGMIGGIYEGDLVLCIRSANGPNLNTEKVLFNLRCMTIYLPNAKGFRYVERSDISSITLNTPWLPF